MLQNKFNTNNKQSIQQFKDKVKQHNSNLVNFENMRFMALQYGICHNTVIIDIVLPV